MIPRYKMLSSKVKCPSSKQENSPVYQTSPPYRIAPSEKEIMKEIIENGPVQGTLLFFSTKMPYCGLSPTKVTPLPTFHFLLPENFGGKISFRSMGSMSHKEL